MSDTVTQAAKALIAAIKIDRHDWEDWPSDSRKAFEALAAALAAPPPEPQPVKQADHSELISRLRFRATQGYTLCNEAADALEGAKP